MIKKQTLILLLFFIFTGFQVLSGAKWDIKESDPTIWLKFCDDIKEVEFDEGDLDSDDELSGDDDLTFLEVANSVINDFNNVAPSYLRFALYPDDPDNPGTPEPGDSTFTKAKAENRTIDICIQSSSNPFVGGHALPLIEDNELIGCEIVLAKAVEDDTANFISTLTHELGHCAGLTHPQETRHAIMSYYNSGEIRLLIDDKMGLSHLFPHSDYDLEEKPTFGLACSPN